MKKSVSLLIISVLLVGILAGVVLACKENYNNKYKHFNHYNKWNHYHRWHYEKPIPPEPTPLPDYCNLGIAGPGNVYGKVFLNEIGGTNMSEFPLILVCKHGETSITKDGIITDEFGSYTVNFLETECFVGDEIQITGYIGGTTGGTNTGIMSANGVCLNLVAIASS